MSVEDQKKLKALEARNRELEDENQKLRAHLERLREITAAARKQAESVVATKPKPVVSPPKPPEKARPQGPSAAGRLGVFLDVANLSGAARRLYGRAVDFRKLLTLVTGPRKLVQARAYAIDKGEGNFEGFAKALRSAGLRVYAKRPKVFPDGTMKADWDLGLTVDVLTSGEQLDVVVLGTGDGDFVPLVRALKQKGIRVELASFGERTASDLDVAADEVLALDATVLE